MRDILFRGKRVDNGEWVYGYLVKSDGKINTGKCYILPDIADFSYGDNGNRIRIGCFIEVDPDTVGQYTGENDKTGVKIFGDDIIQTFDTGHPAIVKYGRYQNPINDDGYHCGFYVDWKEEYPWRKELAYWSASQEIEVVGNIYDKSEG